MTCRFFSTLVFWALRPGSVVVHVVACPGGFPSHRATGRRAPEVSTITWKRAHKHVPFPFGNHRSSRRACFPCWMPSPLRQSSLLCLRPKRLLNSMSFSWDSFTTARKASMLFEKARRAERMGGSIGAGCIMDSAMSSSASRLHSKYLIHSRQFSTCQNILDAIVEQSEEDVCWHKVAASFKAINTRRWRERIQDERASTSKEEARV